MEIRTIRLLIYLSMVFCSQAVCSQSGPQKFIDSVSILEREAGSESQRLLYGLEIAATYKYISVDTALLKFQDLKKRAQKLKNDTISIKILLSSAYFNTLKYNNDAAAEEFKKAETIIRKSNDYDNYYAELLSNRGIYHYYRDSMRLAEKDFSELVNILEEEKQEKELAGAYSLLASTMSVQGKLQQSLEINFKAMKLAEKLDSKREMVSSYTNIGILYKDLEEFEKAKEYLLKALELKERYNDTPGLIGGYLNLGIIYRNLGVKNQDTLDLKKSAEYYDKALKVSQQLNDQRGVINSLLNKAVVKNSLGDYKEAARIGEMALNEAQNSQSISKEITIRSNLIDSYRYSDQLDKATDEALTLLQYYKEQLDQDPYVLKESYKIISELYRDREEFSNAYKYHLQFNKWSDSIYSLELKKNANELETKYQTEKKEKELLATKAEKAETELELSQQRSLVFILAIGMGLLGLIAITVYQYNRRKNEKALAVEKDKNFKAIIYAEEKERQRIARELHDGIVQRLGATVIKARQALSSIGVEQNEEAKSIIEDIESTGQEVRGLSHQMMPRALESGLVIALEELFDTAFAPLEIHYQFEHKNIDQDLPDNIEITLYRIAQELVNNIIKHSQAKSIQIQLFTMHHNIIFMMEDDGVGMKKSASKGIGLQNIKTRVDLIKGDVKFNILEPGTLATVKIPLDEN